MFFAKVLMKCSQRSTWMGPEAGWARSSCVVTVNWYHSLFRTGAQSASGLPCISPSRPEEAMTDFWLCSRAIRSNSGRSEVSPLLARLAMNSEGGSSTSIAVVVVANLRLAWRSMNQLHLVLRRTTRDCKPSKDSHE